MSEIGKKRNRQRNSRSMFRRLLFPLLLLLFLEVIFLTISVGGSGITSELNSNARELVKRQVVNRRNYIENSMVRSWSDLSRLSGEINDVTSRLLSEGRLNLEELDHSSEAAVPLLEEITESLISALYSKRVNGVFVMFNTRELPEQGIDCPGKTGMYIRDLDSESTPSVNRADLLLQRAPISVVQDLNISTDSGWKPMFSFEEDEEVFYDCLRIPYETACQAEEIYSASDYGRWGVEPFQFGEDARNSLAYVQPLVLEDGTIYGVLGIELSTEYLRTLFPYEELIADEQGSYILGVAKDETFTVDIASGSIQRYVSSGDVLPFSALPKESDVLELGGETYYVWGEAFATYSSNTPFLGEQWILAGLVPETRLYTFVNQLVNILAVALAVTVALGILGSLLISWRLSKPISHVVREIEESQKEPDSIPEFSQTGISEVDSFIQTITDVSREKVDSATRFMRIINMASMELAVFEIQDEEDRLFISENFFPMFNLDVDPTTLTAKSFRKILKLMRDTLIYTDIGPETTLYELQMRNGDTRFLRLEGSMEKGHYVGLVENVTESMKERQRIERERDYDLLTGLYNRYAFYRQMEELFQEPEVLGHAALVMLDLDNLKSTNDKYGHDWGDKYIRQAGRCFASAVSKRTLSARVSGDEFYLFFYGYDRPEEISIQLDNLTKEINASDFYLPNGECVHISASAGVAWYPDDSESFNELMKFADFAMYQMKQRQKGSLGRFDLGVYNQERALIKRRRELRHLIEKELVDYYFQPIVNARTGEVFAYEALLRVNMPTLKTPFDVLETAKMENRLEDIERITWSRAMGCYQELLDQEIVKKEALLFVNSIASQVVAEEYQEIFFTRHRELMKRVVVEITESEELDMEVMEEKREALGHAGMIALDDYGSGYNGELKLLTLDPKFIKVDIAIIRDIDTDVDKQKILENIVGYAHERDKLIVAEGVETPEELLCLLERDVDLIQGYFLARPAERPGHINPVALKVIQTFCEQTK